MNKKGMEFGYTQIVIILLILITLIAVLMYYGQIGEKIQMIFGEIFG